MRVNSAACFQHVRGLLLSSGLVLAAGGLGAGCSGAHEPAQQAEHAANHGPGPLVNVPALLGKPISSLRQRLESAVPLPAAYRAGNVYAYLDPAAADSVLAFRSGRLLVLACYDLRSRRVHDLLLLGRHEDSLMQQGALRPNIADYLILPVFQVERAGSLLGLRVVDTSTEHN